MRAQAVAVISKIPRPGRSKTRLARTLGVEAALALHRAFLADELDQLSDGPWQLYLVHDRPEPDDDDSALAGLLAGRAASLIPGAPDLAHELLDAFTKLLSRHDRAVIVSGDVPHLDSTIVARALAALDHKDVVIGPGTDGGYYLVGLKQPHDIFTPVAMGTARVENATVALAHRLGLSVEVLEAMTDMDEAQDLLALERAPAELAKRTRQVVSHLSRGEVAVALPSELQIEVTNRCNLRCAACKRTHLELAPEADLSIEEYRRITGVLPRLERVAFQLNGEPMLHDGLFDMIRDAASRGAQTVLNTNGTLLDARRCAGILECGLHELRVSLDGADRATVATMAGADVLGRITEGVRLLAKLRAERRLDRPVISLWMMATRETIAELPAVVRLAADIGANEVYLQRLVLTGLGVARRESSLHGRADASLEALVTQAEEVARSAGVTLRASGRKPILESLALPSGPNPWLGCWRPWRSAVVAADGRILPCCIASFTAPYEQITRGDLSNESWETIWNGPRYRALRRGLLDGEPLAACRGCNREWSL